jgi:hypothetical protein
MKFYEVERTWICQLGKAPNRKMLKGYVDRNDKSVEEFVRFYLDVISALKDTPAWGVSGVNKMVNKLTGHVRAAINHAKTGKSSAPAQAKRLISNIDFHANEEAKAIGGYRHVLKPLLTSEEIQQALAAGYGSLL